MSVSFKSLKINNMDSSSFVSGNVNTTSVGATVKHLFAKVAMPPLASLASLGAEPQESMRPQGGTSGPVGIKEDISQVSQESMSSLEASGLERVMEDIWRTFNAVVDSHYMSLLNQSHKYAQVYLQLVWSMRSTFILLILFSSYMILLKKRPSMKNKMIMFSTLVSLFFFIPGPGSMFLITPLFVLIVSRIVVDHPDNFSLKKCIGISTLALVCSFKLDSFPAFFVTIVLSWSLMWAVFVDLMSVSDHKHLLLEAKNVFMLTELFSSVPKIATYDPDNLQRMVELVSNFPSKTEMLCQCVLATQHYPALRELLGYLSKYYTDDDGDFIDFLYVFDCICSVIYGYVWTTLVLVVPMISYTILLKTLVTVLLFMASKYVGTYGINGRMLAIGICIAVSLNVPLANAAVEVTKHEPKMIVFSWLQFFVGILCMMATVVMLEREVSPARVMRKAYKMYNTASCTKKDGFVEHSSEVRGIRFMQLKDPRQRKPLAARYKKTRYVCMPLYKPIGIYTVLEHLNYTPQDVFARVKSMLLSTFGEGTYYFVVRRFERKVIMYGPDYFESRNIQMLLNLEDRIDYHWDGDINTTQVRLLFRDGNIFLAPHAFGTTFLKTRILVQPSTWSDGVHKYICCMEEISDSYDELYAVRFTDYKRSDRFCHFARYEQFQRACDNYMNLCDELLQVYWERRHKLLETICDEQRRQIFASLPEKEAYYISSFEEHMDDAPLGANSVFLSDDIPTIDPYVAIPSLMITILTAQEIKDSRVRYLNICAKLSDYVAPYSKYFVKYLIDNSNEPITEHSGQYPEYINQTAESFSSFLSGGSIDSLKSIVPIVFSIPILFGSQGCPLSYETLDRLALEAMKLNRVSKGATYVIDVIFTFLQNVASYVYTYKTDNSISTLNKEWIECNSLGSHLQNSTSPYSLQDLATRFLQYSARFKKAMLSHCGPNSHILSGRAIAAEKLADECYEMMRLGNKRIEPFVVTLIGESGVGKSSVLMKLDQLSHEIEGNSDIRQTAVVQATTKHADTITNRTTAVIFDDYMNFKLSTQPNIATEGNVNLLWQCTGPACNVLPKASVEEKGKTVFNGHFVGIASNSSSLGITDLMTSHQAGIRRFGCIYEADYTKEFKAKYGTNPTVANRLEWEKDNNPGGSIIPSYQTFRRIFKRPANGTIDDTYGPYLSNVEFINDFKCEFDKQRKDARFVFGLTEKSKMLCDSCKNFKTVCSCPKEHATEDELPLIPLPPRPVRFGDNVRYLAAAIVASRALDRFEKDFNKISAYFLYYYMVTGSIGCSSQWFSWFLTACVVVFYVRRQVESYFRAVTALTLVDEVNGQVSELSSRLLKIAPLTVAMSGLMYYFYTRQQRMSKMMEHMTGNPLTDELVNTWEPESFKRKAEETHFSEPMRKLIDVRNRAQTQTVDQLVNNVHGNFYSFRMFANSTSVYSPQGEIDLSLSKCYKGKLLFLKPGLAVLPWHYFVNLDFAEHEKFTMLGFAHDKRSNRGKSVFKITFTKDSVFRVEGADACIIPAVIGDRPRDLTDFFTDYRDSMKHAGKFLRLDDNCEWTVRDMNIIVGFEDYVSPTIKDNIMGLSYYLHDAPSEPGWCGSLVLAKTGNHVSILGMHTGAESTDKRRGRATRLPRSALMAAITRAEEFSTVSKELPYVVAHVGEGLLNPKSQSLKLSPENGCFTVVIGERANTFTPRSNLKEDERRAVIEEIMEAKATKVPAVLTRKAEGEAAATAAGAVHIPSISEMERAYDDFVMGSDELIDKVIAMSKQDSTIKLFPLTDDEAINGVEGNSQLKGLNMSTSAGQPFYTQKRNVFELCEGKAVMIEKAKDELENFRTWVSEGYEGPMNYTSTLKDELKKVEKAHKPRAFYNGSFAATLENAKYLGPLCQFVSYFPLFWETYSGLDPISYDSEMIGRHLFAFNNDKFICGDFASMDKTVGPYLKIMVRRLFIRFAERVGWAEKDIAYMRVLFDNMINPTILVDGGTVCLPNVNPSGCLLTVHFNGMAISLLARMALEAHCGLLSRLKKEGRSTRDVMRILTMGDDHIIGLSDEVPSSFDQLVFRDFVTMLGFTYTDMHKSFDFKPFEKREDLEFCQRKFIEMDGHLWMAYDPTKFVNSLVYHDKKLSQGEIDARIADICNNIMREYVPYGREEFNAALERCKKLLRELGIPYPDCLVETYEVKKENALMNGYYFRQRKALAEIEEHMDVDPLTTDATANDEPYIVGPDTSIPSMIANEGVHIGEFFQRTIPIWSFTVRASSFNEIFSPFQLYMSNPNVFDKVKGFSAFRGNITLDFKISCSSGHYGKLMVRLIPSAVPNVLLDAARPVTTRDEISRKAILYNATHGFELSLPDEVAARVDVPLYTRHYGIQFSADNYIAPVLVSISSVTPIRQFQQTEEPVLITAYASLDKLELFGASAAFVEQAEDSPTGVISTGLSQFVSTAEYVHNIVGRNMLPKEVLAAARFAASAAAIAGFSKPVDVSVKTAYVLDVPSLSTTNAHQIAYPLGLNAENQVETGPFVPNDSSEPLNMESIANRWGYVGQTVWNREMQVGRVITSIPLNPIMCPGSESTVLTPGGFVANMFKYYNCGFEVRFEVLSSMYHTGTLYIQYDPLTAAVDRKHFNVVKKVVLDLKTTKCVTLEIPWQSAAFFLENRSITSPSRLWMGTGAMTGRDMGMVSVVVQAPLISNAAPLAGGTTDVDLLVSCRLVNTTFMYPRSPTPPGYVLDTKIKTCFNGNCDVSPGVVGSAPGTSAPGTSAPGEGDGNNFIDILWDIHRRCCPYRRPQFCSLHPILRVCDENTRSVPDVTGYLPVTDARGVEPLLGRGCTYTNVETNTPTTIPNIFSPPSSQPAAAPVYMLPPTPLGEVTVTTSQPTGQPTMFGALASLLPSVRPVASTISPTLPTGCSYGLTENILVSTLSNNETFDKDVVVFGLHPSGAQHTVFVEMVVNTDIDITVSFNFVGTDMMNVLYTQSVDVTSGVSTLSVSQLFEVNKISGDRVIRLKISHGSYGVASVSSASLKITNRALETFSLRLPHGSNEFVSWPIALGGENVKVFHILDFPPIVSCDKAIRFICFEHEGPIVFRNSRVGTAGVRTSTPFFLPDDTTAINVQVEGTNQATIFNIFYQGLTQSEDHGDEQSLSVPIDAQKDVGTRLRRVFVGEGISSLRLLLRRSEFMGTTSGREGLISRYPAWNKSSYHYYILSSCYGVRGGYRISLLIRNTAGEPAVVKFSTMDMMDESTAEEIVIVRDASFVTFEIPFYHNTLFTSVFNYESNLTWFSDKEVNMDIYYSAAEDFSAILHIGHCGIIRT